MKNIILLLFTFLSFSTFSQEKDAEYYYNVVDSLWKLSDEDYDERLVLENLNEVIRLDSTNAKYFYARAESLREMFLLKQSNRDLDKALMIDSTSASLAAEAHYMKTYNFQDLEMYSLTIPEINKAIKLDPTWAEYHNTKAYLLKSYGKYEESLKTYEIAKSLDTTDQWLEYYNDKINEIRQIKPNTDFKRNSFYYPYTELSERDSLKYPIKIGVEFNLYSLEVNKIEDNLINTNISAALYTNYPDKFVAKDTDTITIADLAENISIRTSNKRVEPSEIAFENTFEEDPGQYYYYWPKEEYIFDHTWDLSDFPFDNQKIKVKFEAIQDTSVYVFEKFQKLGFKNHFKDVAQLPVGMKVKKVNYYNEYITTDISIQMSPFENRKKVVPVAVYEIVLSRSGSLLFIKLFLGTFLAFIMSLSAFTISKRNFPSRIDVSVGALFIAVGNKYFVESTTPMVQILTKADIINNISLLLIIMNVFFIISQHRKDINIGKFEDSKYTLKFSASLLAALVFITIIF